MLKYDRREYMEEKKTMKEKKNDNGGLMGFLMETVFRNIQSFVDGVLGSVQEATDAFTRRLARRAFLFFFALVGFIFLFLGFARLLSTMYRMPGLGEAIVGVGILVIVLIVYIFNKDDN